MPDVEIKNPEGDTIKTIDESVAVGTLDSDRYLAKQSRKARVQWTVKGSSTTGELQGSLDGTTFVSLQTLAAGLNVVVGIEVPFVRIRLTQATSPQNNTVFIHFQN